MYWIMLGNLMVALSFKFWMKKLTNRWTDRPRIWNSGVDTNLSCKNKLFMKLKLSNICYIFQDIESKRKTTMYFDLIFIFVHVISLSKETFKCNYSMIFVIVYPRKEWFPTSTWIEKAIAWYAKNYDDYVKSPIPWGFLSIFYSLLLHSLFHKISYQIKKK